MGRQDASPAYKAAAPDGDSEIQEKRKNETDTMENTKKTCTRKPSTRMYMRRIRNASSHKTKS